MGCVCCSLSSFISILLDACERITLCTVCAMLTCCLLLTILTMMVLGIGIGYHYCFVQSAVEAMEKAAQASKGDDSGSEDAVRTIDRAMRKKTISAHRVKRREADLLSNNTLFSNYTLRYSANNTYYDGIDAFYNNTNYVPYNGTNYLPYNGTLFNYTMKSAPNYTYLNTLDGYYNYINYLSLNATNLTGASL